jgi:hypothetical protein
MTVLAKASGSTVPDGDRNVYETSGHRLQIGTAEHFRRLYCTLSSGELLVVLASTFSVIP